MKKLYTIALSSLLALIPLVLMAQPMNGNYTVNSGSPAGGTNFQSLAAFSAALTLNGISGDVYATVVPGSGPYLEQVEFSNIQGLGPNATVTLDGSQETFSFPTTTANRHIIRLRELQYFTLSRLRIAWDPSSTGGFYGIHILNTGQHITISECEVDLSGTTSTLYGAYVASGSETSLLITGDFHNVSILNNSANGGGYGASVFGLVSNLASNILIEGNTFTNFHSNGIYLRETNGAVVRNNFFDKTTTNVTSFNAIQLAQAANINAEVYNNFIQLSAGANGTMTFRGIYLFNGTGHRVYNNVISNINLTSGNVTGIEIRTGATAPEIYFNTISIDNAAATSGNLYGIKEELSNSNATLRNNMISITQPSTGNRSGLVLATNSLPVSAFNSDYNNIYVPGGNVAQKGTLTTVVFYPALADWQAVGGQDMNSSSTDPLFFSPSIPAPTNQLLDNTGIPVSWVLSDYLGQLRGIPPDIGAFEFSSMIPIPPDSIYGSTELCENTTTLFGVNTVPGAINYTWAVSGGASILSGQGSSVVTVAAGSSPFMISVFASNVAGNSNAISLNVNVFPAPTVSFTLTVDTMCLNYFPFVLSGGSPPGGTYSGPGVSNGIFNPAVAGTGAHYLTYTYQDINYCTQSGTATMTVMVCTDLAEQPEENGFTLYPNPSSGSVVLGFHTMRSGSIDLIINDITGRVVYSRKEMIHGGTLVLPEVSNFPEGIYMIRVIPGDGIPVSGKLIRN